jgi:hypothetical protein
MIYFCVIGEQKCGTSWLFQNLYGHPELYFENITYKNNINKIKEPNLFINNSYKNIIIPHNKKYGDFTPQYLSNKTTALKIYNYNPNMKIIIILRNPLERAKSQYKMQCNFKNKLYSILKNISFTDAFLNNYPLDGRSIKQRSLYYSNIIEYHKYFKNLKIIFNEDIKHNPKNVIDEICKFLEIDTIYNNNLNKIIRPLKYNNKQINISNENYDKIKQIINPEMDKLSDFLKKDISNYKM